MAGLEELDRPNYYQGQQPRKITCENCGTMYNTRYCGESFGNTCMTCGADLRPKTVTSKIEKVRQELDKIVYEDTTLAQVGTTKICIVCVMQYCS